MREMRGEVAKKTPKKEMDNPPFLWRHMADFWDTLSSYIVQDKSIVTFDKIQLPHLYVCQKSQFNYSKAGAYGYKFQTSYLAGKDV